MENLSSVRRVIVFGFGARGDSSERSDIDLAIDIEGPTAKEWQKVLDVIENAETLIKIDCFRMDTLPLGDPLRQAITRDGVFARPQGGDMTEAE